jgi:hypothetical protein
MGSPAAKSPGCALGQGPLEGPLRRVLSGTRAVPKAELNPYIPNLRRKLVLAAVFALMLPFLFLIVAWLMMLSEI